MVLDFFRTPRETGLEHVENQVSTMLTDCRHNFDTAMNALVGGTRPDAVRSDVRTTDLRINEAELLQLTGRPGVAFSRGNTAQRLLAG